MNIQEIDNTGYKSVQISYSDLSIGGLWKKATKVNVGKVKPGNQKINIILKSVSDFMDKDGKKINVKMKIADEVIDITSENEGKTFSFIFPIYKDREIMIESDGVSVMGGSNILIKGNLE